MLVMPFKFDVTEVAIQLAVVGTVGYFAVTFGPTIMQAVTQNILNALGQGAPPTTVSGDATTMISGSTTTTCTTGNPQMDQMITAAGVDLCQYTGQGASGAGMGAGGLGALNNGIPNYLGSAYLNTGGIPGQFPGTIPPNYAAGINYPQYTGATQFQATPLGSAQITCPNGICRSYVGEVINV
jgi:hypothetical protein